MFKLNLRSVTPEDRKLLFGWANDPVTRAMSRSQNEISWTDHSHWFSEKISSDLACIWIAESDGKPVGQFRLDSVNDTVEIDYSIAPSERNKGLGTKMLSMISSQHSPGSSHLIAYVRENNFPSIGAFRKSGFSEKPAASKEGYIVFFKDLGNG